MSHWKTYDSIPGVTAFAADGVGPFVRSVDITANCHASDDYPDCRIVVGAVGIGSLSLTVQQSRSLRAMLELAESDVVSGCPALAVEEVAGG